MSILKLMSQVQQTLSILSTPPELNALLEWLHKEVGKNGTVATPEHTMWAYKALECSFLAYKSGKLVVNSRENFMVWNKFKETGNQRTPSIAVKPLGNIDSPSKEEAVNDDVWEVGMDEAGKGDLFGPQVAAVVACTTSMASNWRRWGVKDSKLLSESEIYALARRIKATPGIRYKVVDWSMDKFNAEMARLNNQNSVLLAQHMEGLNAVASLDISRVIIDQFTSKPIILAGVPVEWKKLNYLIETKAERYLCVAAASILAREGQLRAFQKLSTELGFILRRGCSKDVKKQASMILKTRGLDTLKKLSKLHFKTFDEVTNQ
jgi:ribonuclease HIII